MIRTVTRCAHCGALELDGLEVDVQRREVRWQGRGVRSLTMDVVVLRRLVEAGGELVSHGALHSALYGSRDDGGPMSSETILKIRVHAVRKLLREIGAPVVITTIWGQGYRLDRAPATVSEAEPKMETADA